MTKLLVALRTHAGVLYPGNAHLYAETGLWGLRPLLLPASCSLLVVLLQGDSCSPSPSR